MCHSLCRALCRALTVLCCIAMLGATPAFAIPMWGAPVEVSQGRAFVAWAVDSEPFQARVDWQGNIIRVEAEPVGDGFEAMVMLAMPLDAKGSFPLVLRAGDASETRQIRALKVEWLEQRLTVEPKYVEPPKDAMEQINRDTARNRAVLAGVRQERMWSVPLERPVPGGISGSFANRRVFNGQPRSPHKGTDMRGALGSPIKAVADGIVALAEPQYFSGNVIYVDHGQGVFSLYAHLSAFDVREGDRVEKGQIIGRVGATGRVTGPHLHMGFVVRGVSVDIMPLFTVPWSPVGGPTKEDPKPQAAP